MKKTILVASPLLVLVAFVWLAHGQPNAIFNSGFGFTNESAGFVISSLDASGDLTLCLTNSGTNTVSATGITNVNSGTTTFAVSSAGAVTAAGALNLAGGFVGASTVSAAKTITGSNGFASYGTNNLTLAASSVGWTNTNAFNMIMTFTNGVSNLFFSNGAVGLFYKGVMNAGVYSQPMPPGSVVTNTATSAVIWQY